jgi:hypothetical protein
MDDFAKPGKLGSLKNFLIWIEVKNLLIKLGVTEGKIINLVRNVREIKIR